MTAGTVASAMSQPSLAFSVAKGRRSRRPARTARDDLCEVLPEIRDDSGDGPELEQHVEHEGDLRIGLPAEKPGHEDEVRGRGNGEELRDALHDAREREIGRSSFIREFTKRISEGSRCTPPQEKKRSFHFFLDSFRTRLRTNLRSVSRMGLIRHRRPWCEPDSSKARSKVSCLRSFATRDRVHEKTSMLYRKNGTGTHPSVAFR